LNSVSACGGRTICAAGPLAVHVHEVDAAALVGPAPLHAFEGRARTVDDSHHAASHGCGIELAHDHLHRADRTQLIAMNAAGQRDALAGSAAFGHDHREEPGLDGWSFDAAEATAAVAAPMTIGETTKLRRLRPRRKSIGIVGGSFGRLPLPSIDHLPGRLLAVA
jgi:hypothetical protein